MIHQHVIKNVFSSTWVFFHGHSQFTGQQAGDGWGVGVSGVGGWYLFNSSLPLPPASQTLRH